MKDEWYIIGRFEYGDRVIGGAGNITEACCAVQKLHLEYLDKELLEIWYQSKSSWHEARES